MVLCFSPNGLLLQITLSKASRVYSTWFHSMHVKLNISGFNFLRQLEITHMQEEVEEVTHSSSEYFPNNKSIPKQICWSAEAMAPPSIWACTIKSDMRTRGYTLGVVFWFMIARIVIQMQVLPRVKLSFLQSIRTWQTIQLFKGGAVGIMPISLFHCFYFNIE